MKSTHYRLGEEHGGYKSEMADKFNQIPLTNQSKNSQSQNDSNVQIGASFIDLSNRDRYTSTYENQYAPKMVKTNKVPNINSSCSIVIGS